MSTYKVTFERIGRDHGVPPVEVEAATAEGLAAQIYHVGRPYLRSRGVEVVVDMEARTGMFLCGFHSGGAFAFEPVGEPQ